MSDHGVQLRRKGGVDGFLRTPLADTCQIKEHAQPYYGHGCVMDALWMRYGCVMDALWMRYGCVMDAFQISFYCNAATIKGLPLIPR